MSGLRDLAIVAAVTVAASTAVPVDLRTSFTDTCQGVTTTVTNQNANSDVVSLIRHQTGVDPLDSVPGQQHIPLRPGQSHTATVAPEQGRGFSLRWQSDSILDIGDEFHSWHKPNNCNGLPVTGADIGTYLSVGIALLFTGIAALLVTRKHRTRTNVKDVSGSDVGSARGAAGVPDAGV